MSLADELIGTSAPIARRGPRRTGSWLAKPRRTRVLALVVRQLRRYDSVGITDFNVAFPTATSTPRSLRSSSSPGR